MNRKKPKVLYFDIETSPMEVYTHYIGSKVSLSYKQIKKHKRVICICYQWDHAPGKVHALQWNTKTHDDSKMLKDFNKIAASADVLKAHNGDSFDIKELRAAMALRDIETPWCETESFDTLKIYRASFRFVSNRLDAIARHLGLGHKDPMGFQDWIDVMNNVPGALAKMVKYCKKDVRLLRNVDKRLEKYIKLSGKTNNQRRIRSSYLNTPCPSCGSKNVVKNGLRVKKDKKLNERYTLQRFLCRDCSEDYLEDLE